MHINYIFILLLSYLLDTILKYIITTSLLETLPKMDS